MENIENEKYNLIYKKIKSNLHSIILSFSSLTVFFMIIYMLLDMQSILIKLLMVLEFLFDFYFMARLFYKYQNYKKKEKYIEAVFSILPFMLSVFNLFYVFNFFSIERVFLRNAFIAFVLTNMYQYIFSVYILRIIELFYSFSKEKGKTFHSLIASNITIFISVALLIIFLILYIVFNNVFVQKVMPTYKIVSETIIFEAENTFTRRDIEKDIDAVEYKGFAETYDIVRLYYDNEIKYSNENFEKFKENYLLFETSILSGAGFLMIRSGKVFTTPFYTFLILYIIALSFTAVFITLFIKYIIKNNFDIYINIIIHGFKDENYNYALNTSRLEDNEIKELSELYNNKLLPYKYRERYIKSVIK